MGFNDMNKSRIVYPKIVILWVCKVLCISVHNHRERLRTTLRPSA